LEEKAAQTIRRLIDLFWDGKVLGTLLLQWSKANSEFFIRCRGIAYCISMLYEDDFAWDTIMTEWPLMSHHSRTVNNGWKSRAADFQPVLASWFDHPVPSSISLAEMGLTRVDLLAGKATNARSYLSPYQADFFNITVMMNNGLFHLITSNVLSLVQLPANTLQMRGKPPTDCYRGTCRMRQTK